MPDKAALWHLKNSIFIICVNPKGSPAKIMDWLLIAIALILFVAVFLSIALAETSDPLRRQELSQWSFGEGLAVGDFFEYQICDSVLKIPESPDPCYVVTLEFLQLLPSPQGNAWVVAAHVDHHVRQVDMIFQILADSFEIKTDGTTIPYADSIKRTLGWIKQHASNFEPKMLAVGKSWGVVDSQTKGAKTELLITQVDSVQIQDQTYDTYKIGYYLTKESFVQIKDEFPFPVKAVIYKPVSSYQNIPLAFTVDLLSHSNSDVCNPSFEPMLVLDNKTQPQIHNKTLDMNQYSELLDDDSGYEFDIMSTEKEIKEIENYKNGNDTLENLQGNSSNYEELGRLFGNFTSFFQTLTEAIKNITQNQTGEK